MSYLVDGYHGETAATAPVNERVAFIRRTYAHLAVAGPGVRRPFGRPDRHRRGRAASSRTCSAPNRIRVARPDGGVHRRHVRGPVHGPVAVSRSGLQYAGLTLYVLLYTLLFVPILTIASSPHYGSAARSCRSRPAS